MSQNNMELGVWGDGEVRLSYWDPLHGEDRHFIIRDISVLEECEMGDNDEGMETVLMLINLNKVLRKIAFECCETSG